MTAATSRDQVDVVPTPDGQVLCPECQRLCGVSLPDREEHYCRRHHLRLIVRRTVAPPECANVPNRAHMA